MPSNPFVSNCLVLLISTALAASAFADDKKQAPSKEPTVGTSPAMKLSPSASDKVKKPLATPRVRINEPVLLAPYYTGEGSSASSDPGTPPAAGKAKAGDKGTDDKTPSMRKPAKTPASKQAGTSPGTASVGAGAPSLRLPADATSPLSGGAKAPSLKGPRLPSIDGAPRQLKGVDDLADRMEGLRMKQEIDGAGLGRDLDRSSSLTNPATGEPLEIGRRNSAFGSLDLPGRGSASSRLSRGSSATDPLTGRPLLGGDPGDSGKPGKADARAAGRAGKGMAMDDGDETTEDTRVLGDMSFDEAWMIGLGNHDGVQVESPGGGQVTIHSNVVYRDGQESRVVYVVREDSTYIFEEGKEPEVDNDPSDRPAPDDAGSGNPRPMTEEEKKAMEEAIRNAKNIASRPAPGQSGGVATSGSGGEVLTDLDLAGRPRDDADDGGARSGGPGPVLTDLGLAGQPVGDDPDFGVLPPQNTGRGTVGGFGSALRRNQAPAVQAPDALQDQVSTRSIEGLEDAD